MVELILLLNYLFYIQSKHLEKVDPSQTSAFLKNQESNILTLVKRSMTAKVGISMDVAIRMHKVMETEF